MGSKGWFRTEHRDGDRTVDQQLIGLEALLAGVSGKTVLDVGCAEGLIDDKIVAAGAKSVHGVEIVASHVDYARKHLKAPNLTFEVADASHFTPEADKYDVVLLLAILHKLKDPMGVAFKFGKVAREMVVVRMPPAGAVIKDARSGGKAHDVGAALQAAGLQLSGEGRGTFDEWIGYYTRPKTIEPDAVVVDEPAPLAAVDLETQSTVSETKQADPETNMPFERTVPLRRETEPPSAETTTPPAAEPQDGQPAPPTDEQPPAVGNVPPESVHPGGDPAEQLTPERIEPPALEGTVKSTVRRNRGQRGAPDKTEL